MANLFAFRATESEVMFAANDPIGQDNDRWLAKLSQQAAIVIAAWGNSGGFKGRSNDVKKFLPNLHCLRMNKSGEPAHPLYQKASLEPLRMQT